LFGFCDLPVFEVSIQVPTNGDFALLSRLLNAPNQETGGSRDLMLASQQGKPAGSPHKPRREGVQYQRIKIILANTDQLLGSRRKAKGSPFISKLLRMFQVQCCFLFCKRDG